MKIRKAKKEDLSQIVQIAKSLKINTSDNKKGFLVYVLDEKAYAERLISDYFIVAEEGDTIAGFIMAYDDSILGQLISSGILNHEISIVNYFNKKEKPFIWGDQIGIHPEFIGKGVGSKLINKIFHKMKENKIKNIYVDILHYPLKNMASISFCIKNGFKNIDEVKNIDAKIWGIYFKKI